MDTKNYINDCEWEITDDGTLVIRPANGRTEGTLHRESFFWPWYGETFKRVRIEVKACPGCFVSAQQSGPSQGSRNSTPAALIT